MSGRATELTHPPLSSRFYNTDSCKHPSKTTRRHSFTPLPSTSRVSTTIHHALPLKRIVVDSLCPSKSPLQLFAFILIERLKSLHHPQSTQEPIAGHSLILIDRTFSLKIKPWKCFPVLDVLVESTPLCSFESSPVGDDAEYQSIIQSNSTTDDSHRSYCLCDTLFYRVATVFVMRLRPRNQ